MKRLWPLTVQFILAFYWKQTHSINCYRRKSFQAFFCLIFVFWVNLKVKSTFFLLFFDTTSVWNFMTASSFVVFFLFTSFFFVFCNKVGSIFADVNLIAKMAADQQKTCLARREKIVFLLFYRRKTSLQLILTLIFGEKQSWPQRR